MSGSSEDEADTKNHQIAARPGFGIRHLQVAAMCSCVMIFFVMRSGMGLAILAMTDTVGNRTDVPIYSWNKRQQNIVLSAFFWGYTLVQIPSGILAKRYGPKLLILVGLLLNSLMSFLTPVSAFFGGWMSVAVLRLIMGLGQGFLFPSTHTLTSKWLPMEERSMLSSIVFSGGQIGTIVAMPACAAFADSTSGWPAIFMFMGIISFTMLIVWLLLGANSPAEHRFVGDAERVYIENALNKSGHQAVLANIPWRSILTSLPVMAIAVAHTGSMWAFIIFLVEIPSYLKQMLQIDMKNSGLLSALPFAAMLLMSGVFGFISDVMYRRKVCKIATSRKIFQSISAFGAGLGYLALAFIPVEHANVAIAALTATVGSHGATFSGYLLNHLDLSPSYGGVILGLTNGIANLIASFAPILNGILVAPAPHELSRWRSVFVIASAFCILCNVFYLYFGSAERQDWDKPNNVPDTVTLDDIDLTLSLKEEQEKPTR